MMNPGPPGRPRLVPLDCALYDEYATVRRSITLLPSEVHQIQAPKGWVMMVMVGSW